MKQSRLTVMAALIRSEQWTRGAELGLWQGQLYGYLLQLFPQLVLIGVDHWQSSGAGDKDKGTGNAPYAGKDMVGAEAAVRALAARYGARARIVKAHTVDAAALVPDASLDFVFIDASHDTASVSADIAAWRSKVRSGGMLTGHDSNWPSVQRALSEWVPGWTQLPANVWAFRVP